MNLFSRVLKFLCMLTSAGVPRNFQWGECYKYNNTLCNKTALITINTLFSVCWQKNYKSTPEQATDTYYE